MRSDNWGRWGPHDELGALNLVTDSRRLAALETATRGRVYSLAHPVGRDAPVTPRRHPVWHTTTIREHATSPRGTADDVLILHSHSGTHLDALSHVWADGKLYNGVSSAEISSDGARRLSIDQVGAIVTRAVVLDLDDVCPEGGMGHGFEVTVEHLQEAETAAGVRVRPGDAVLLRTGWRRMHNEDPAGYQWGEPGIGMAGAAWLAERDVVLVGADTWAVEAVPPAVRGAGLVVHHELLVRRGVYLLENLDLEELATAEGPGAYLLVVAPLRIAGGVGSPVNPIVVA